MLRDVTLGQFYKTESLIHRLDPRVKIIYLAVMMLGIFSAQRGYEYALCILLTGLFVVLSRVPAGYILKGMKPVWLLVGFTAVINLFMTGGENVLFEWKFVRITVESVSLAAGMALRVMLLVTVSTLLTLTTSPTVLTEGIERLLRPLGRVKFPAHEVAMMMSIALRFIPTLIEEAEKITKAQAARGNDIESGGLIKKAKAMIPLFVPLFVSAFRRADELAMAMECRCYRGGENRTSFKVLVYKRADKLAFGALTALVLIWIIFRVIGV